MGQELCQAGEDKCLSTGLGGTPHLEGAENPRGRFEAGVLVDQGLSGADSSEQQSQEFRVPRVPVLSLTLLWASGPMPLSFLLPVAASTRLRVCDYVYESVFERGNVCTCVNMLVHHVSLCACV